MSNNKAWFERDPLPRAVIDRDCDLWLRSEGSGQYHLLCYGEDLSRVSIVGASLEEEYGPCVPLAPETGQTEPPSSDALTIPAGELKRALELRMGEHANRIIVSGNYHPEDAVKTGNMAQLALAVNPNTSTTWVLTPVKCYATDESPEN